MDAELEASSFTNHISDTLAKAGLKGLLAGSGRLTSSVPPADTTSVPSANPTETFVSSPAPVRTALEWPFRSLKLPHLPLAAS